MSSYVYTGYTNPHWYPYAIATSKWGLCICSISGTKILVVKYVIRSIAFTGTTITKMQQYLRLQRILPLNACIFSQAC